MRFPRHGASHSNGQNVLGRRVRLPLHGTFTSRVQLGWLFLIGTCDFLCTAPPRGGLFLVGALHGTLTPRVQLGWLFGGCSLSTFLVGACDFLGSLLALSAAGCSGMFLVGACNFHCTGTALL